MKKLYLLILAAFTLLSCNDDFLERYPLDEISPNDYWKTPNDLKIYCNQFYGAFPVHSGWSNFMFYWDNNSDNLVPRDFNKRLAGTRIIPSSGAGWNWKNIHKVNYILANYKTVNGAEAEIKHYVGEAKFFRAWYYFEKVKSFGNVPWISKPLNIDSPELYDGRLDRNVIVDSILVDLDYAIENLKTKEKAESFRLNRSIALAFKSRVCLYEGTWEKYHANTVFGVKGSDGTKYLQLAAEAAGKLITEAKYSVYKTGKKSEDYHNLFNQVDYSGNSEVMLWKKYDKDLGVTHNLSMRIPQQGLNTGLSKSLVDSYLCTDGNPISSSPLYDANSEASLTAITANRDARLSQTVLVPKDIMNIQGADTTFFEKPLIVSTGEDRCTSGFQIFKGATSDYDQRKNHNIGTIGCIVFRWAEVLLNYAEAKAELGTITQGDIDKTINELRSRVGMPDMKLATIVVDPNKAFPALSDIINEVRRERRVELALEGQRLNDLLRWRAHDQFNGKKPLGFKYVGSDLDGAYLDKDGNNQVKLGDNLFVNATGYIDTYKETLPAGFNFDPKRDYLNPMPTEELLLNPKLGQNPGWE